MKTPLLDPGEEQHSQDTAHDGPTLPQPSGQPRKRRRSRTRIIILLAVVILSILGVSVGIVILMRPGQLTLTDADEGKTVLVHVGDQITIQLDANATTGFQWAIDKTDTTVLALQHSTYTPTYPIRPGSGGTQVFTFVAQHSGAVHLQLKYWRSWEGGSSIVRRYDITVQVQDKITP